MVAGLVAMGILADKSGDVGREVVAGDLGGGGKEAVQLFGKGFFATHQSDESLDIVGHEPSPLPGRTLAVIVGTVGAAARIKGRAPGTGSVLAPHEADRGVEIVGVGLRKLVVALGQRRLALATGHLGDTPVVVGVLQGLGHALVLQVAGHVAHLVLEAAGLGHDFVAQFPFGQHLRDAGGVEFGHPDAGSQCLLRVEVALSLGIGVCCQRYVVITYHTARVVGHQFPLGYDAALLALADEATDVGLVARGVNDGEQGVQGAESVPHGKDGVVGRAGIGRVDAQVHAAVTAVDVGSQRGRDVGVIERGVEDAQLLVPGAALQVCGQLDAAQHCIPLVMCGPAHAIEIPRGYLGRQIGLGSVVIHSRAGGLDQQGAVHIRGETQQHLAAGLTALGGLDRVAHHLGAERLRELRVEVNLVVVSPTGRTPPRTERVVVHDFHLHLARQLLLNAVIQI